MVSFLDFPLFKTNRVNVILSVWFCFILRKQNAYFVTTVNMEYLLSEKRKLSSVPNIVPNVAVNQDLKGDEKVFREELNYNPKKLSYKR